MDQDQNTRIDRPVVLVGMMAAGKTHLGRDLARVLRLDFMDTDRMIEDQAQATIAEIFERDGEVAFRDLESAMLRDVFAHHPGACVISTGGGAVIRPANADLIFGNTISVWVRASIPLILARTTKQGNRPLLKNDDPEKTLRDMAEIRYPIYGRAGIVIDVDDRWPADLVPEIIQKIEESLIS